MEEPPRDPPSGAARESHRLEPVVKVSPDRRPGPRVRPTAGPRINAGRDPNFGQSCGGPVDPGLRRDDHREGRTGRIAHLTTGPGNPAGVYPRAAPPRPNPPL